MRPYGSPYLRYFQLISRNERFDFSHDFSPFCHRFYHNCRQLNYRNDVVPFVSTNLPKLQKATTRSQKKHVHDDSMTFLDREDQYMLKSIANHMEKSGTRMKWNTEIRIICDKYTKYKNISYIYACKMADT